MRGGRTGDGSRGGRLSDDSGVTSLAEVGDTPISGDILLQEGAGITITRAGQTFTIASGAAASGGQIGLSDHGTHQVEQSDGETLLVEWNVDSAVLVTPTVCRPRLSALVRKSNAAAVATLRLRVGGTVGALDGTVRASLTATAAAFTQRKDATPPGTFDLAALDAGAGVLVKLTLETSGGAAADTVGVRASSVVLSG